MLAVAKERADQFRALIGLIQRYYVKFTLSLAVPNTCREFRHQPP